MGTMFNPAAVMMGNPSKTGVPYFGGKTPASGSSQMKSAGQFTSTPTPQASGSVVGPESVRATGSGPFDSAYRQDLATYAGGLFGRPGGNLSFDPTSNQPFGGAATGGGNAPVLGMPNTLLQNALGGNPFSYAPPAPPQPPKQNNPIQAWLQQFMNQNQRGRSVNTA